MTRTGWRLLWVSARLRPSVGVQAFSLPPLWVLVSCAAVVSWLLLACTPEPTPDLERVFDFGSELANADIVTEVRSIDFGAAQDRQYLIGGWSRGEHDPAINRSFAWGLGEESVVEFPLLEPRALELTLEGQPLNVPGAPPQEVSVSVNGHLIADLELAPGRSTHVVNVDRDYLVSGVNRLVLAYRWSKSPRELARGDDRRLLAVAWTTLRFGSEGAAVADPSVDARDKSRVFLPFGSELVYHLVAPPGSELRVDRWSTRGTGRGRLEIAIQAEHQPGRRLLELTGSGRQAGVPLSRVEQAETGQIDGHVLRLKLRSIPAAEGAAGDGDLASATSGVMLQGAAIWSPAQASRGGIVDTASQTSASQAPGSQPRRPNIVLYVIDTLRADHLGCYGYGRPISPRLDAFADEAVLFEHAIAQSSWTRSSMASIFTGLWPYTHATNRRSERLNSAAETLPERLRDAGYRTAAFVTNPNLTAGFGFDQGFDYFDYLGEEANSAEVHRQVAEWLAAQQDETPFLLYVHTLDPHAPYIPPPASRKRWAPGVSAATADRSMQLVDDLQAGRIELTDLLRADLEALYDAEIAANDASFGALIDELTARELYDETLLIVVSDHGEEFHEHGNWQHGRALHSESIDVPLIIKLPGMRSGGRVGQRVQHVDLLPTLLDYLSLEAEPALEGRSLLPWLTPESEVIPTVVAGPEAARGRVFSYLHLDGAARVSVQEGGWKLIQQIEHGRLVLPRLYRLAEDPGELDNLADRYPIRKGYLATAIRRKLTAGAIQLEAEDGVIDDSVKKSLQALGYLD